MNGKIFVASIGFVVGGVAGFIIGGKTCANRYRDTIQALERENDELSEEARQKVEKKKKPAEETKKPDIMDKIEKIDEDIKKKVLKKYKISEENYDKKWQIIDKKTPENKLTFDNFGEMIKSFDFDLAMESNERFNNVVFGKDTIGLFHDLSHDYRSDENKSDDLSHPFKTGDIYLISDDDFRKDLNYRDSETMTYYQEDHVLADSADMPVHDEEEVIGVEALDELPTTEEDYLYVSNDIENKMYEIIVEHNQSFYRDVLGMEV